MRIRERITEGVFTACAAVVVLLTASIILFVGANAYQTFTVDHVRPMDFFFGRVWQPDEGSVGSLVLIIGSFSVTLLAVLLSTPISVGIAIFVTEIAPAWAKQIIRPVLELLTGIPSIIYGFVGLQLLVPLVARAYNWLAGGHFTAGYGIIAATLVLSVMILPTIASLSIDALNAVPASLREASLALGATRWQTIFRTLVPASATGIMAGVILGMGRAIGETLAVSFVIGSNANSLPIKFDDIYPYFHLFPTSTITVQLLFDFKEAVNGTLNYHAIWTLAFVLMLISSVLVLTSRWIASRSVFNTRPSSGMVATLRRGLAQVTGKESP